MCLHEVPCQGTWGKSESIAACKTTIIHSIEDSYSSRLTIEYTSHLYLTHFIDISDNNHKMYKIARSATNLYRVPKISQLRINSPHLSSINQNKSISFNKWNTISSRHYSDKKAPINFNGSRAFGSSNEQESNQATSIVDILDREIKDELAELSQHLADDQFPGFSVEANDADVKLTKQCGSSTVTVRFTVSSSLSEWPCEDDNKEPSQQDQAPSSQLVCMPDFQVQIKKANSTLEMSCYFEEMETDEETGEPYATEPVFGIDELVLYNGEPKETEYAVSAEYFQDDLQDALMQFLGEHGIDDEFGKNLVTFATSYEKKQYIGLMQRLKNFVTK